MKTFILIGAAAAAFLSAPASAQPRGGDGVTRADVETRVRGMFARVDANRDGFVTEAEALAFRGPAHAGRRGQRGGGREAAFARLDANGDGMISRAEFTAPRADGQRDQRRGMRAERRQAGAGAFGPRAFARVDANRDGRISLAEATTARLRAFERTDADRDGRITREERQARRAARQAGRS